MSSSISRTKSQLCREEPDKMVLVFLAPKPQNTVVFKVPVAAVDTEQKDFLRMYSGQDVTIDFDDTCIFETLKSLILKTRELGDGPFEVPLGRSGHTCTIIKMDSLKRPDLFEILNDNDCGRYIGFYYNI